MKALRERAFNLRWATLPQDVIPLTAADPDFQCAPEIVEAINRYSSERVFSYGPPEGLPSFREVIASTLLQRRNVRTSPQLILPVDSAAQGMLVIARYALKPGDEAIIFDPVDFLFTTCIEAAGGVTVRLPVSAETRDYSLEVLKSLITPKTKMLCICNPLNPVGKVFTKEELTELGNIAVENDLLIMNDEIWSDIIFPPTEFVSIASISPQVAARTLTVYGFSKSFGIAGMRVGYIVSPNEKIHEGIMQASMVRSTISGVATISQVAAQTAYEKCWYWVDDFIAHLTKMRDYTVQRLNGMRGMSCTAPQGCYLAFPNITATGKSSEEVTAYLMKEAKVAVVPGAEKWFGPGAEGHIRICFSTSHSILQKAFDRMEDALEKL